MLAPQVPRGTWGIKNLAQNSQMNTVLTNSHKLSQTMRMQHHPSVSTSPRLQLHTPLPHDTKLCHHLQRHPVDALLQLHARRCTSADRRSLQITTRRRAKTPTTIRVASDPCDKHLPPIQSRHPPRILWTTALTINLTIGHAQFCWPTTKTPNNIHPPNCAKLHH